MNACPSPLDLERYTTGALALAARSSVEAHVVACDSCGRWLAQARSDDEVLALLRRAVRPANEPQPGPAAPPLVAGFRVVRLLGEGGMGVVWEAEQEQPRRLVALKVIRPGVASARMLLRFEHEAAVLARLQHPGIAQIFAAGTYQSGTGSQPWFAMELVHGEPLLAFAATHALGHHDRVRLMVKVCDAVHHAHQKGVIHRDLKPGNLLVDANGEPRVLDFGVARMVDTSTAENARQTLAGQLVGTLPYMSPEQVTGDPDGIDTRADVYALGVVAYELLTGTLPYDVADRPLQQAVQAIAEAPPVPPGARDRSLSGDLDNILLRALAKEPAQRYPSASDLARDLERFLAHEPIAARPPSALYQLRKFARRQRAVVLGVAVSFLLLVAGIVATSMQVRRARAAERDALRSARTAEENWKLAVAAATEADQRRSEAETENKQARAARDFLQEVLIQASPAEPGAPEPTLRKVLDTALTRVDKDLVDLPVVEAAVRHTLGRVLAGLRAYDEADQQLRRSLARYEGVHGSEHGKIAQVLAHLAEVALGKGDFAEMERLVTRALAMRHLFTERKHGLVLATLVNGLGSAKYGKGRVDEALADLRRARELYREVEGDDGVNVAIVSGNLALCTGDSGRIEEAEAMYPGVIAQQRKVLGAVHPSLASTLAHYSSVLSRRGHFDAAEAALRESRTIEVARFGLDSERVATVDRMLGALLFKKGDREAALELVTTALTTARRLAPRHYNVILALHDLGGMLRQGGRLDEAERAFRESLALASETLGDEHPLATEAMYGLGLVLVEAQRHDEAIGVLDKAIEIDARKHAFRAEQVKAMRAARERCLVARRG